MSRFILMDTANLFFRARHAMKAPDLDMKVGMGFHIMLNSVKSIWQTYQGDHVVFFLEGRSWRKDFYPRYKANRHNVVRTEREQEEEKVFWEAYDSFVTYLKEKTNCSVFQSPKAEADDLIARFIDLHPNHEHIIVSTDSDLHQLLAPNVSQYNGIEEYIITTKGFFQLKNNKPVIDKKTNAPKKALDPEWLLFEKSIRGDATDNIFTAYPRVRTKQLKEAFDDIVRGGYAWNNLMLSKWEDHEKNVHVVKDLYERNKKLIDLRAQPEEIIDEMDKSMLTLLEQKQNLSLAQIGGYFMKFCGKWNLIRISETPTQYTEFLNAGYPFMEKV